MRTPDLVVGVWDEVSPDLGEGVGDPGVRLGGRREGRDLHVEVVVQVRVLRLRRVAQVLLLEQIRGMKKGLSRTCFRDGEPM